MIISSNPSNISTFGQRVRELRIKKGIKQGDFAESIGISRQRYIQIELHDAEVSISLAQLIADKLGTNLNTLTKGSKKATRTNNTVPQSESRFSYMQDVLCDIK